MAAFDDLLTLQEHDTAADRLRHRRDTLPERAALAEAEGKRAQLDGELVEARARRDEVVREERKLDDEVRTLEDRAKAEETKMYSGTISSPRELQAMSADVAHLRKRARELEDEELEVLERREAHDTEVAGMESVLAGVVAEIERMASTLAEAVAEIEAELGVEQDARAAIVPGIPANVLSLYEQVRAANRGMGAARLVGGNCQACHLALPATEVDRIRHMAPDAIARCEHCGAILVR
ncbi:MAG: zinc ribbon domain-containing protein [Acidimicrobiia bacterium]